MHATMHRQCLPGCWDPNSKLVLILSSCAVSILSTELSPQVPICVILVKARGLTLQGNVIQCASDEKCRRQPSVAQLPRHCTPERRGPHSLELDSDLKVMAKFLLQEVLQSFPVIYPRLVLRHWHVLVLHSNHDGSFLSCIHILKYSVSHRTEW